MSDGEGMARAASGDVSGSGADSGQPQQADRGSGGEGPKYKYKVGERLRVLPSTSENHLYQNGVTVLDVRQYASRPAVRAKPYGESDSHTSVGIFLEKEVEPWNEDPWSNAGAWESTPDPLASGEYVSPLQEPLRALLAEAEELLLRKNHDYGSLNITQAPGGPMNGLRVRMHDKLARLNNLVDNDILQPNFESMRDTCIDLLNYSAIALLVLDGNWHSSDA